ncbi:MAG: PAS domain-containing sensor histidine kinase [Pseudomonadota bacterium]|nr:PAS domain-containing sensor histidine kinase [Pseudomonadota bacterium]
MVTDDRGVIRQVNATFCGWVGMTAAELVGKKKLQELFTVGGRIFHQTHWLPSLQMQGSLAEVKFDVRHRDGRSVPMMVNAVRRSSAQGCYDQISLVVAEERNKYERELLRARQRADAMAETERAAQRTLQVVESRLRQAMRVGAFFLWDVDPATGERRYEDEVARLLGWPHAQPVDAAAFQACIAAADRALEASAFEHALEEPDRVHTWTCRLATRDGSERVVFASGQAFLNPDGTLFRFVGVLSDITDISRRRAEAEDRALFAEQMVGIVSHDLRNPLSAIMMGATLLTRERDLTPRKARVLEGVVRSTQRARRLIDDLLDFTLERVGPGLSVSLASVDLHELVSRALEELVLAFPGRALRHVANGEGAVHADPDRIAQLLGNLVANALTYGAPGGEVIVTSTVADAVASVCVHNDGQPLSAESLGAIFEPMVRGAVDGSPARSVGLGLFIVRAIALAHRGTVSVRSSADDGTAFTFAFPAGA